LIVHARALGLNASVAIDPADHLSACPLVVTCTPADAIVLRGSLREDAFVAAVGAFTPKMIEVDPALCGHCAESGTVVVDTPEARHEAGDLLQAGLDVASFASLREVVIESADWVRGPVLFKSCGWAGWDLAAARVAVS
jgi:1-piperideine-2-carboxylate/1-pyrroline-2-carboxylate reductase [NAD(P)H]